MAKILLIEPNPLLASVYTQAFRHVGHDVQHATEAQGAIYAADTSKPDVVILEIQLGGHDGIAFLHEFRSYNEWHDTPVIINTYLKPAALEGVRSAFEHDLGVSQWLYKPRTTLAQLLALVATQTEPV